MAAVAFVCLAAAAGAVPSATAVASTRTTTVADKRLLPDLRMAPLTDVFSVMSGTQRQLRFSATIVNTGAGPFELLGTRASTSDPMTVEQHIYHSLAPVENVTTAATMFFAGDGHSHWHVKNLETYRLIKRRGGAAAGTSLKSGFCFADDLRYNLLLPGVPPSAVYVPLDMCARNQPDSLTAPMGLSVGWGDMYRFTLPDQFIDITGLASGAYRLIATADGFNRFTESNETNNSTKLNLRIRATSVTIG